MAAVEKRTVTLLAAQASYIDAQVTRGKYASACSVVRAGLRALQEREAEVDRWLGEDVAPVHDAMTADPSGGIPLDRVMRNLRAHHVKRLKAGRHA